MSRIHVETTFLGQALSIAMGYDFPLKSCFVSVDLTDEQADDPAFEKVVQLALLAMVPRLSAAEVIDSLKSAEVAVPMDALSELEADESAMARNKVVNFDQSGTRTQAL